MEEDEAAPKNPSAIRDEENQTGLQGSDTAYEDIEMSGALPRDEAVVQAKNISGADGTYAADIARDGEGSDEPTQAVEDSEPIVHEASNSIITHYPGSKNTKLERVAPRSAPRPAHRIRRRHSS